MDESNANAILILLERTRGEMTERLTRMEGRQEALQAADVAAQREADHRHRNMIQVLDTFVPRREIEANERAQDERITAVAKASIERIDEVKSDIVDVKSDLGGLNKKLWAILLGIVGAFATQYLNAFGIHLKP